MKKQIALAVVVALMITTGCASVGVHTGDPPPFEFKMGETVEVINRLQYEVVIIYKTRPLVRLGPGQPVRLTNLCDGEYLFAQIYKGGQIIGIQDFRIRKQRSGGSQLWRITQIGRLRGLLERLSDLLS